MHQMRKLEEADYAYIEMKTQTIDLLFRVEGLIKQNSMKIENIAVMEAGNEEFTCERILRNESSIGKGQHAHKTLVQKLLLVQKIPKRVLRRGGVLISIPSTENNQKSQSQ